MYTHLPICVLHSGIYLKSGTEEEILTQSNSCMIMLFSNCKDTNNHQIWMFLLKVGPINSYMHKNLWKIISPTVGKQKPEASFSHAACNV